MDESIRLVSFCLMGFAVVCLVPLLAVALLSFIGKQQVHRLKPYLDRVIMPDLEDVEEKVALLKAQNLSTQPLVLAKEIVEQQALKSGRIGFLIGLGGFITVPVNVAASIRNQAETIQLITVAFGHCFTKEEAKIVTYIILSGQQGVDALSQALARALQRLLIRIVGRTILRTVVESIPIFGALTGAGLNYAFTKYVAGPFAIAWCEKQQGKAKNHL
ncbi:MAG: hypothetical protein AAF614_06200 [Chloroflexota bacterium]